MSSLRTTLPLLVASLALAITGSATASKIHLRCRDGVLVRRLCAAGCPQPPCDRDARCDGVCTFVLKVCGEVACRDETFPVPVGQVETVRPRGGLGQSYVLRCRRH